MWILTQDDSFVNCDNIYIISVRKNSEGWEIYADNVYDKRAKLGVYKDHNNMEMALEGFGDSIGRDDKIYGMPPDFEPLQWDEIDKMSMKGLCHGEQKEDHT